MNYLDTVDYTQPGFGEWCDELSLWSAPFGLRLLERVPMKPGLVILDVGAGTGFLTIELAQRCGSRSKVIAVDPWNAGMNRLRRKVDYLGLTNVTLLEQNAAAVDLPDASEDVIVSNLGPSDHGHRDHQRATFGGTGSALPEHRVERDDRGDDNRACGNDERR